LDDIRIRRLREALEAFERGDESLDISGEGTDEIARLGAALGRFVRHHHRCSRESEAIFQVTERINAGLVLEEVLEFVYDAFRAIIPYDRMGFAALEEDGETVRAVWAKSDTVELQLERGFSAPLRGSSLEDLLRSNRPRIISDLEAYQARHPDSESTRKILKEGIRSSLTCPLVTRGKPVGFLFFSSREREAYDGEHVQVFRRIAGQVAATIERSRLYERLLELSRTKDRFLGMAAHDLRHPLTVIKGNLGLLMGGAFGEAPEIPGKAFERMDRACRSMLAIIDDLLDVHAIESGRVDLCPKRMDLRAFLEEAFETWFDLAEGRGMVLKMRAPPSLPAVEADPGRLRQVLDNLLSNALKYSHPGAEITLGAAESPDKAAVQFSVEDSGQGIAAEEIPRVFQDFGRTSNRPTNGERSTGLGLAISRRIVESHGGTIWVESEFGRGSTFTFSLPLGGPSGSGDPSVRS